jgi:hypothetical protein
MECGGSAAALLFAAEPRSARFESGGRATALHYFSSFTLMRATSFGAFSATVTTYIRSR